MTFTDLKIEEYTSKSVVVNGETRKYKEDLKKLGGKYNGFLNNGPGWIFPKSSQGDLVAFIKKGKRLVTEEEAKTGEERSKQRAKEWEQSKNERERKTKRSEYEPNHTPVSHSSPTLSEYGALLASVNKISFKMERMEQAIILLLDEDQKKQLEVLIKPPEKVSKVVKKVIRRKVNTKELYDSDTEESEEEVVHLKRLMKTN